MHPIDIIYAHFEAERKKNIVELIPRVYKKFSKKKETVLTTPSCFERNYLDSSVCRCYVRSCRAKQQGTPNKNKNKKTKLRPGFRRRTEQLHPATLPSWSSPPLTPLPLHPMCSTSTPQKKNKNKKSTKQKYQWSLHRWQLHYSNIFFKTKQNKKILHNNPFKPPHMFTPLISKA